MYINQSTRVDSIRSYLSQKAKVLSKLGNHEAAKQILAQILDKINNMTSDDYPFGKQYVLKGLGQAAVCVVKSQCELGIVDGLEKLFDYIVVYDLHVTFGLSELIKDMREKKCEKVEDVLVFAVLNNEILQDYSEHILAE